MRFLRKALSRLGESFSRGEPLELEESLFELKEHYTIIIVPHSIQQAARVADQASFFLMGDLVECAPGKTLFTRPGDKRTEDYVTGRFG